MNLREYADPVYPGVSIGIYHNQSGNKRIEYTATIGAFLFDQNNHPYILTSYLGSSIHSYDRPINIEQPSMLDRKTLDESGHYIIGEVVKTCFGNIIYDNRSVGISVTLFKFISDRGCMPIPPIGGYTCSNKFCKIYEEFESNNIVMVGRTSGIKFGLLRYGPLIAPGVVSSNLPVGSESSINFLYDIHIGSISKSFETETIMRNQYLIDCKDGEVFFQSGDSGSMCYLIEDSIIRPLGLLYGKLLGNRTSLCIASPIDAIMFALDNFKFHLSAIEDMNFHELEIDKQVPYTSNPYHEKLQQNTQILFKQDSQDNASSSTVSRDIIDAVEKSDRVALENLKQSVHITDQYEDTGLSSDINNQRKILSGFIFLTICTYFSLPDTTKFTPMASYPIRKTWTTNTIEIEGSSIKTSLSPKILLNSRDHLYRGRQYLNEYVSIHPNLKFGSWISIVDDDSATLKIFNTYQQAADAHRSHKLWFCSRYLGPNNSRVLVESITTGQSGTDKVVGNHQDLRYINIKLHNPDNQINFNTKVMIDTGAMVCVGTKDELTEMEFREVDIGTMTGGGGSTAGTGIPITYVDTIIQIGTLDPISLQIAYPDIPKGGEQWIIGQSFLNTCKHTWSPDGSVRIEYPLIMDVATNKKDAYCCIS